MGFFDEFTPEGRKQVQEKKQIYKQLLANDDTPVEEHKSSKTHEVVVAGGAALAMAAWEKHQKDIGEPVEHAKAKEALAGFVGFELDKLAETKGEDFFDRMKVEHACKQQAAHLYDEKYGDKERFDPNEAIPDDQYDQDDGAC